MKTPPPAIPTFSLSAPPTFNVTGNAADSAARNDGKGSESGNRLPFPASFNRRPSTISLSSLRGKEGEKDIEALTLHMPNLNLSDADQTKRFEEGKIHARLEARQGGDMEAIHFHVETHRPQLQAEVIKAAIDAEITKARIDPEAFLLKNKAFFKKEYPEVIVAAKLSERAGKVPTNLGKKLASYQLRSDVGKVLKSLKEERDKIANLTLQDWEEMVKKVKNFNPADVSTEELVAYVQQGNNRTASFRGGVNTATDDDSFSPELATLVQQVNHMTARAREAAAGTPLATQALSTTSKEDPFATFSEVSEPKKKTASNEWGTDSDLFED